MATTYRRTCTRCTGTGMWADRGECFGCLGFGTVKITRYSAAEKIEIRARQERFSAAKALVVAAAETVFTEHNDRIDVAIAIGSLRDKEPARFEKLLAAVDAGQAANVAWHLHQWFNGTRVPVADTMADMVSAVKAHALANYAAGWDGITECYTDAEIAEVIENFKATTVAAAIDGFSGLVDAWNEQAASARNAFSY